MANSVWHTKFRIYLDLTRNDLGHPEYPDLWDTIYRMDRMYAARGVPVSQRDLQCGGVCQEAGVTAWMHLRLRANGRREAVHERAEDEERHVLPMSDEHKAYQERILRAAEDGGFRGDSEVRTRVGRSWIQTDTLIEGADGRRIGWEVQLSSAGVEGPRSVRARAAKAEKNGITPAWHTDRADYAHRQDTQWTRSNNLPAHVIAKTGDLRVIWGFRAMDFWRCDLRAVYPCPDGNGVRRCGKHHATPKPRDILFDDLVRETAAGAVVPIQFRIGTKPQRFWVTSEDRGRLDELRADDSQMPAFQQAEPLARASWNRPTCRLSPRETADALPTSVPTSADRTAQAFVPTQPSALAREAHSMSEAACAQPVESRSVPYPEAVGLPAELVALQRAADSQWDRLGQLNDNEERKYQRLRWYQAAAVVQEAVTKYARANHLNRCDLEKRLRHVVRSATTRPQAEQPSASTDGAGLLGACGTGSTPG
ncbi:hypothetical protein [Streptomyces cucumeris]|uniref:hypothetical protein n=1 Tax=Streptomyces cucumeris TaxID=2962890 RepID=UPI003D71E7F4